MPQLNPTPWFITSSFSWMVFLIVLPPKVLAYVFPHKPTPKLAEETKTHNWNWPWQ